MTVYVVTAEIPNQHDRDGDFDGEFLIPGVFTSHLRAVEIGDRYERDGYEVEIWEKEIDKTEDVNAIIES